MLPPGLECAMNFTFVTKAGGGSGDKCDLSGFFDKCAVWPRMHFEIYICHTMINQIIRDGLMSVLTFDKKYRSCQERESSTMPPPSKTNQIQQNR